MVAGPRIDRATLLLVESANKFREITGPWLERLGFIPTGAGAWRLWIPDELQPECETYLQLLLPDQPHGAWTAELLNIIEGETIPVGIPKPMTTQGNVLFLLTAVGGRVLNPYVES